MIGTRFRRPRLLLAVVLAFAGGEAIAAELLTLPAAASIHGAPGTFFHSDVSIFNTSTGVTANVTARYRCQGGSCGTAVQSFAVPPRQSVKLDDIVGTLFKAPETSGAIEFESDQTLVITSRLYTPSKPQPTVGQFIPALKPSEAYSSSVLLSLSHSADASKGSRTNVGVYNGSDTLQHVVFTLYDDKRTLLGAMPGDVSPHSPFQISDVFTKAGVTTDVDDAFCIVSGDGTTPLYVYASVLDNQSQDPIFVRGQPQSGFSGRITLPSVASLHGAPPTFFHSDVRVYNPSTTLDVPAVTYRCFTAGCAQKYATFLGWAGKMIVFDDIAVSLFGAAESAGAVEIQGFGPLLVTSRLYTPSHPAPTVGQFIPGLPQGEDYPSSVLTSLAYSPDNKRGFRSNVGVYNGTDVDQSVTFSLYAGNSAPLGAYTDRVAARGSLQVGDIFRKVGVTTEIDNAYCIVRGEGINPLFSYASVLDNQSQDPVFIVGQADQRCVYGLSVYAQEVTGAGGSFTFEVTAPTGCGWTASPDVPWVRIDSGSAGTGSGTVRYAVLPSTVTTKRAGVISIAGRALTIQQSGGSYAGNWSGQTDLGKVSFSVPSDSIRSISISLSHGTGSCVVFGSVNKSLFESITDNKVDFTVTATSSGITSTFHFIGTFTPFSSLNGTMQWNYVTPTCSAGGTSPWTATRQ